MRGTPNPDDIRIAPLAGALGAEVRGIDLAAPLDESCFAVIRRALLDYLVIFFPDQELGPGEHRDFAARFDFRPAQVRLLPGADGDVGALVSKGEGYGPAHATAGTADDCHPVSQSKIHRSYPKT